MDNTMRAAVVREFGQPLVIEEVDVPRPKQGEVLMKVAAIRIYTQRTATGQSNLHLPLFQGMKALGMLWRSGPVSPMSKRATVLVFLGSTRPAVFANTA